MSAHIAWPKPVLAAIAVILFAPPALAGPWGLDRGEWYANLEGSTYTSNTFRLADGGLADTGLAVEQRALRAYHEIGWKGPLTLVFSVPVVSVTRRDAQVQGTATGFQDVLLGTRMNLRNAKTALALELDWSAPAGYLRGLDSLGLRIGDGLQELSLEVQVGTAIFGRGFVEGSLGYGYRYLGFGRRDKGAVDPREPHPSKYVWADRLLASADAAVWLGHSLLAAGRYRGLVTLSNGALMPEANVHLAGPLLLYRIDDRLDVFAGSWSTASGKNTLHFNQVYVGMAFHKTKLDRLQGFLGGTRAP